MCTVLSLYFDFPNELIYILWKYHRIANLVVNFPNKLCCVSVDAHCTPTCDTGPDSVWVSKDILAVYWSIYPLLSHYTRLRTFTQPIRKGLMMIEHG